MTVGLGAMRESELEPIDLTEHAVLGHFARTTRNVQLLNFLMALDRVDRWAVDYADAEKAEDFEVQVFLQDLKQVVESSVAVLHRVPRELTDILAHLTTTRCMYLIRYISLRNPQFPEQLGVLLEGTDTTPNVITVRRRLEAFSRARLLGEIFSGARLNRIVQIMGSYSDA
ncbi:type IV secretion protein IcmW (plasmid) [Xanthomonas campestris pv. passiflorae]